MPFPESSLNDEAGMLHMHNYSEFFKRAKLICEVHAMKNKSKKLNHLSGKKQKEK